MGEALIDLVLRTDGSIHAFLGGGPFNTARALGRLDVPVAFLGRISDDAFGRQLIDMLRADGVDLSCVVRTDDPTTLALAELDSSGAASYRFYIDRTSVPGLTPDMALSQLPASVDALHVGTLALVLEPFASACEAVVTSMAERTLVFVDPNVRPRVINDRSTYLARLDRFVSRAAVVKVSDDDLEWIAPGDEPEAAARDMLASGAGLVLVTFGGDGALVVGRDFTDRVTVPPVVVVDTIGAGDSFSGGVLAWWYGNGKPPLQERDAALEAARFGCRVAARTVAVAGANPPRRAELAGVVS